GGAEGAPARCAALLRAHPDAVEVAAGIDEGAAEDGHASRVLEREWVAEADDRGVRVTRVERYGDARAAATAAVLESALPREGGFIHVADPLERVARGTEVRFEAAVAYDDLALRAQDVARLGRAMTAEMAFAWRLVPIAEIDVHRFEIVDRQVYVRRQRLEVASLDERLELSRELVALLDQALVVHPLQERLAEIRYEVLLRFLGDAPGAARTAELALEAHPDDRQTWLARRREALIAFDLHGAGQALEEARVAGQGRGRVAAGALRALLEGAKSKDSGPVSYPLAEAALATAERIESFTADERLAAPVLVEWHALAETALALFELRDVVEPSDRLLALVRGSLPSGAEAPPSFVELERGRGLGRRVGLAPIEGRGGLRAFPRPRESGG
ncbi:MAG: hypothetical protein H5U40_00090, partial [Polyangiaceae bacterium]|nr:hypothetical protein [Polyangiaceae bacterium]